MKATKVNIYLVRAGGLHPVLAEVTTDSGLTGLGEAAIAYSHPPLLPRELIKDLADNILLGRAPCSASKGHSRRCLWDIKDRTDGRKDPALPVGAMRARRVMELLLASRGEATVGKKRKLWVLGNRKASRSKETCPLRTSG